MKFGVSKKIMRPYVTLLNIFSEIAHIVHHKVSEAFDFDPNDRGLSPEDVKQIRSLM